MRLPNPAVQNFDKCTALEVVCLVASDSAIGVAVNGAFYITPMTFFFVTLLLLRTSQLMNGSSTPCIVFV